MRTLLALTTALVLLSSFSVRAADKPKPRPGTNKKSAPRSGKKTEARPFNNPFADLLGR